jgi:hypothetical protein
MTKAGPLLRTGQGVWVAKPPLRAAKPRRYEESDAVRVFRGHTSLSRAWAILGSNQ